MRKLIGPVLRKAREAADLSLRDLSRLSGMSVGQISQLETGVRPDPAFSTVARLAAALQLPLDALAAQCGYGEGPVEAVSGLTQSARERLRTMRGIEDASAVARRLAEHLESLVPTKSRWSRRKNSP